MQRIPARMKPRPYEEVVVVLAVLGVATPLIVGLWVGLILSVSAGCLLASSIWLRHQPMTYWTRLATLLVIAGLVIQLLGLLTTPLTPVRAG